MLKDFNNDRAAAREAELIVLDALNSLTTGIIFEDVADDPFYYYKGDIIATDASGKEYYIEVKDDSRIADTKKILCEEENYLKESDRYIDGNMRNHGTNVYCIVSKSERKIYVLDYNVLQSIYRKYGEYKIIYHAQQNTYCYLLELCRAKQFGALLATINY